MAENTDAFGGQEDLTEGDPADNELIKKLRKQLSDAKAQAKAALSENEAFRETRTKQRVESVTEAVNGLGYPQAIVDTLLQKVQDVDEDEYLQILSDLSQVAPAEEDAGSEPAAEEPTAPSPSSLGQQLAAATSGGQAADTVMQALMNAKSVDEVNAIAAEAGLGDI